MIIMTMTMSMSILACTAGWERTLPARSPRNTLRSTALPTRVPSVFQKKYKEECFEIGLDDCKGAINDKVHLYCGRYYIDDYSVLEGLKFKCGYKVAATLTTV